VARSVVEEAAGPGFLLFSLFFFWFLFSLPFFGELDGEGRVVRLIALAEDGGVRQFRPCFLLSLRSGSWGVVVAADVVLLLILFFFFLFFSKVPPFFFPIKALSCRSSFSFLFLPLIVSFLFVFFFFSSTPRFPTENGDTGRSVDKGITEGRWRAIVRAGQAKPSSSFPPFPPFLEPSFFFYPPFTSTTYGRRRRGGGGGAFFLFSLLPYSFFPLLSRSAFINILNNNKVVG